MFPSGRAAPGGGRRVSAALCCFAAGKMASRRITRETFDAVVQDKVKRYRAERGDALQEAMHHFKGNGTRRGCGGCPRVWPRRSAAALLCCHDRPRLRADGSARPALFERGVRIQGKSRIWDKGIAAGRCERRRLKGGGVGAAWRRLCSLGGFV